MTLAINWSDESGGGFIFFDAVTLYSQDHSGKTTAHPIDAGGSITDHFIRANSKYKIGAVISGLDISTGSYLVQNNNGDLAYNTNFPPNAVSVNSTDSSVLRKFLPDSLGQFLSDSTPDVVIDAARTDLTEQIRDALISLTSGVILDQQTGQYNPNIQLIDLYEYDGYKLTRVINRLVMTNVTFRETPDTGYALYCDFSFEQVTFATLKRTQIPQDVQSSLKKKASPKSTKGRQDSTIQDASSNDKVEAAPDLDPERQARANNG